MIGRSGRFVNNVIQPLLIDLYEITMAYSYWKAGKQDETAVFDLTFRRNPFAGEFTIFTGLQECVNFLENFRFTDEAIAYFKKILPDTIEPEFFTYLASLTPKDIKLSAINEGSVVFPKLPLLTVEGPLPFAQMLETAFLNLINFASLVSTNAARYRIAATDKVKLFEFGMRRAQGPDGALTASKYSFIGGFDGSSNVLAGLLYDIPITGTHAHSYVMTYQSLDQLKTKVIKHAATGRELDFVSITLKWSSKISNSLGIPLHESNEGELAAFISYALAFPESFVALVDTYDVIRSGLINFCAVAFALDEAGYRPVGIRIDSGDLAYLSKKARRTFDQIANHFKASWFAEMSIIASNDLNEDIIYSLNEQNHSITAFAIGTHLVTCQKQPALGCVYKLTQINGKPCIKLSEDLGKITIPGRKKIYRLFGSDGYAILDLLAKYDEPAPAVNSRILCHHPILESKRAYVTPSKVVCLQQIYWSDGKALIDQPNLDTIRSRVLQGLKELRPDMKRYLNPTPYKVSVTRSLYEEMHKIWLKNAPIGELL
ncbi:nicotinate phosphoribosyltransferase isoform X2 [Brevipalpus obovatus]|uniref:nicotinate phosphoribosyltransferase isoform X2 n=1 Tax=Brevipalpus obovatus TaxID=246614 RepID=UPI003D9EE319